VTRPLTLAVDRATTLIVGLALIAVGTAMIVWRTGLLPALPAISFEPLVNASHSAWWPWAVACAGIALVVAALAWLLSHLPARRGPTLRIHEPGDRGTITVDLDTVAGAAAAALAQDQGVRTARGRAVTEGGTNTIVLTVTVDHPAAVANVIDRIDATCAHIATIAADSALATRTLIQLPKADTTRARLE
jgi:hypothetical protein